MRQVDIILQLVCCLQSSADVFGQLCAALRAHLDATFEHHLVKRPQIETRIRLPQDQALGGLTSLEMLDLYWRSSHTDPSETQDLASLAAALIQDPGNGWLSSWNLAKLLGIN